VRVEAPPELTYAAIASRKWRANNAEVSRERSRGRSAQRYAALRVWLATIKSTVGCQYCGEADSVCLDFHHLDPTRRTMKEFSANLSRSSDRVLAEMQQCLLLCSNCHRKATHGKIDVSHLEKPDYDAIWSELAHLRERQVLLVS
jgi:5-methylcytosine-specific restriction endonuclease McrA